MKTRDYLGVFIMFIGFLIGIYSIISKTVTALVIGIILLFIGVLLLEEDKDAEDNLNENVQNRSRKEDYKN